MTASSECGRGARLRRSCLAVPGSSEKMLAKAATLQADMVFVDLEDAVAPQEKTDATRARVVEALRRAGVGGAHPRGSRERGLHPWCFRDIDRARARARDVLSTASWCRRSRARPTCTSSTTCSPSSRRSSGSSAGSGSSCRSRARGASSRSRRSRRRAARYETLIFGPGDFAASLGMPQLSVGASRPRLPRRPVALRADADR